MSQSLFSLEVVVNYLKVQHEKISCLFPSIAFRLLDYPTIAINFLDEFDAKQLKQQLEMNKSYQPDLKITHFRDLLDKHGRYIFAKGKSCLFRSELAILRGHLRNAPLYAMLLDAYDDTYKLLGTSAIPLTNLIEEMCQELYETNLDMPCTKITHGVFDIKNLMGDDIGHISFACRLSSFGSTLLPHIGITKEAIERQNKLQKKSAKKSTEQEIKQSVEMTNKVIENTKNEKQIVNTLVQTVPIDYKTSQIQISNADLLPEKIDSSTQIEDIIKKIQPSSVEKPKKKIEDEFVFNHYCPPPLQYNSEKVKEKTITTTTTTTTIKNDAIINKNNVATSIVQNIKLIKEQKHTLNEYEKKRIDYLNDAMSNQILPEYENETLISEILHDNFNDDDDFYDESYVSIDNQKQIIKSKQQQQQQQKQQDYKSNESTQFDLENFPILKSLVEEISKLKSLGSVTDRSQIRRPTREIIGKSNTRPNTARPSITQNRKSIIKSADIGNRIKEQNLVSILKDHSKKRLIEQSKMNKEEIIESVNRLSKPKSALKEKQKEKNNGEKKPKLVYGTTNAYRMRVLASRPDKAKKIDDEHSLLINQLKKNLDNLTDSSQNITPSTSLNNFKNNKSIETNPQQFNQMSISNSTYNGNKSPLNLSLLNKVEMESTIDYALSRNIMNNVNSQDLLMKNSLQQLNNQQSSGGSIGTKFVQFGNTVVLNQPSDDSGATPNKTVTNTSTTSTTNSFGNKIIKSVNQLPFVHRKSSQTSSISSTSKSKQTSDDFENDFEEVSIKMSHLNFNDDEQIRSSSKYSSNDFCTETSKSKVEDFNDDDDDDDDDGNIFSRESGTSTY